jgi:hypothetical protein
VYVYQYKNALFIPIDAVERVGNGTENFMDRIKDLEVKGYIRAMLMVGIFSGLRVFLWKIKKIQPSSIFLYRPIFWAPTR